MQCDNWRHVIWCTRYVMYPLLVWCTSVVRAEAEVLWLACLVQQWILFYVILLRRVTVLLHWLTCCQSLLNARQQVFHSNIVQYHGMEELLLFLWSFSSLRTEPNRTEPPSTSLFTARLSASVLHSSFQSWRDILFRHSLPVLSRFPSTIIFRELYSKTKTPSFL